MAESLNGPGAPFYRLADMFAKIAASTEPNTGLSSILAEFYPAASVSRMRILIVAELDRCIERISLTSLKTDRVINIIGRLRSIQDGFIQVSGAPGTKEFTAAFPAHDTAELIRAFGDAADTGVVAIDQALDRESFLAETRNLLDFVNEMEIPAYASRVLHLKLTSLVRIVETCAEYSDDEIRRRIKAIYADFCAEFSANDKGYEKAFDTMTRWAKTAMVPTGLLCLGLVADAATVAGLLTADPGPALLPPPQD